MFYFENLHLNAASCRDRLSTIVDLNLLSLQIRSMDQIEQKDGANEAEFQDAKPAGLLSRLSKKGSYRSLTDEPEGGFFSDLAKNTE